MALHLKAPLLKLGQNDVKNAVSPFSRAMKSVPSRAITSTHEPVKFTMPGKVSSMLARLKYFS